MNDEMKEALDKVLDAMYHLVRTAYAQGRKDQFNEMMEMLDKAMGEQSSTSEKVH